MSHSMSGANHFNKSRHVDRVKLSGLVLRRAFSHVFFDLKVHRRGQHFRDVDEHPGSPGEL